MSDIRHILLSVITPIRNVVHIRRYLPVKRVVLFEGGTDRNHLVTKSCHNLVYAALVILESLGTLVLGLRCNEWTICCLTEKRRTHVRAPVHDMLRLEMVNIR
jgi:hypothetical protein